MPVVKEKRVTEKGYGKPLISDEVKSHADDPFVTEQVKKAKEFFLKHPLPDHLKNK